MATVRTTTGASPPSWALLVVRELLLGPRRFADLRAGPPNASPDVLSRRLRGLEGACIARRRKLPPGVSPLAAQRERA